MRPTTPVMLLLLAAAALLAGGCAKSSVGDTSMSFDYDAVGRTADFRIGSNAASVAGISVVDARPDTERTGTRVAEKSGTEAEVAFGGSLETWIREGAEHVLSTAGVGMGEDGDATIEITVEEVMLREDVYVQAEYDGRVGVTAVLRRGGRDVWDGRGSGFAENYGRPAKQVNYAETVNHALFKALDEMFGDPAFRRALEG